MGFILEFSLFGEPWMKRLFLSFFLALTLIFTPAAPPLPLIGVQQVEAGFVKKTLVVTAVGAAVRYGGRAAIRKVVTLSKDPAVRSFALQKALELAVEHPALLNRVQDVLVALEVKRNPLEIIRYAHDNRLDYATAADVIDLGPAHVPPAPDLPGLAGGHGVTGADVAGLQTPIPPSFDTWAPPPPPTAPDVAMAPPPAPSRGGSLFDAMFGSVERQNSERDQGVYDPRRKRDDVVAVWGVDGSSTMPMNNYPTNPRHITGTDIVIARDQRGFPIFDKYVVDTAYIQLSGNRDVDNRRATTDLRHRLEAGVTSRDIFTEKQLRDIFAGKIKIFGMVWHHHQDCGRMELLPEEIHNLYHRGSFTLCDPE